MAHKSGLDLLKELINEVKILNKKFEITDQSVKLMYNKINELESKFAPKKEEIKISATPVERPPVMVSDIPNDGKTRILGKILDKDGKYIKTNIKVYNVGNQLVKETNTNAKEESGFVFFHMEYIMPDILPKDICRHK